MGAAARVTARIRSAGVPRLPHPPAARAWSVSALELYAQCPFKFYSRYVLRLAEERDDDDGLSPLERGRMHHELFETILPRVAGPGTPHRSPPIGSTRRARWPRTMLARHLDCLPASWRRSNGRGSWVRPSRPGSSTSCCAWRPSGRRRGGRAPARAQARRRGIASRTGRHARRATCAGSPIASTCCRTAHSE